MSNRVITELPGVCEDIDVSGGDWTNTEAHAVYVGTAGDVVVRPAASDTDVTFTVAANETILPCLVTAVRNSGTTATGLKVLR